jgi:hypothetical protein
MATKTQNQDQGLKTAQAKPAAKALPTLSYYPDQNKDNRKYALFSFAALLIIWNILGHFVLGFEQAWQQPLIAVGAACLTQFILEAVESKAKGRAPRYKGTATEVMLFYAPALISGLAVGMLLYPNRLIMPVVFASVLSIASKVLFRAPLSNGSTQHIFNPSNFGITVTLFLLPFIGVAPPYHFVENISGIWDWLTPMIILMTGLVVHGRFTHRLPLVLAWLSGFVFQAFIRHQMFGVPLEVPLAPMTSCAFIIFTLYMIPDPATTPIKFWRQIAFGLSVAAIYGALQVMHLFFGLFVALIAVSLIRGLALYWEAIVVTIKGPQKRLKSLDMNLRSG